MHFESEESGEIFTSLIVRATRFEYSMLCIRIIIAREDAGTATNAASNTLEASVFSPVISCLAM
jgi:hypothetical protein